MARLPDIQEQPSPVPTPAGGAAGVQNYAGQGLGAVAQTSKSMAGDYGAVIELVAATNARQDEQIALDAANRLNAARLRLEQDPKEGFVHQKGNAVVSPEFASGYQDRFKNEYKLISDGLSNQNQRKMLDRHASVVALQYQSALMQHQAKETTLFNATRRETTIDLGLQDIAAHPFDDSFPTGGKPYSSTHMSQMIAMSQAVVEAGKELGLTGSALADYVASKTRVLESKALSSRVLGMMNKGESQKAIDFFHDHELEFDANDRVRIGSMLKTTVDANRIAANGKIAFEHAVGVPGSSPVPADMGSKVIKPYDQTVLDSRAKMVQSPSQFDSLFEKWGKAYNISPAELKLRAVAESGLNKDARNAETGATGLMQFMPETAKSLNIDPRDPEQAIIGAAILMSRAGATGGANMEAADRAYYGGNTKANGPNTNQYVENLRALRLRIKGEASAPMTIAGLEAAEGQVIANAEALADRDRPGDAIYKEHTVSEARKHLSQQLGVLRGKEYAVYSGLLSVSIGEGAAKGMSDLTDPQKIAYTSLSPEKQHSLRQLWKSNINEAEDIPETPENTRKFTALMGQAVADPIGFKARDIANDASALPKIYRHAVINAYNGIDKEAAKGGQYNRVLNDPMVKDMLQKSKISPPTDKKPGNDDYWTFVGMIKQSVDNYIQDNGKQPTEGDYQRMAASLLQKVKVPGAVFGEAWPNERPLFKVKPLEVFIGPDGVARNRAQYTNEDPARPNSFEEAQKLPSGTPFINPTTKTLMVRN